jgi:phosphoserine phosphatase
MINKVFVPRQANLALKVNKIRASGPQNLAIVADFDQTLIKAFTSEGKRATSSFLALIEWSGTPLSVSTQAREYFSHYYPIEQDLNLKPEVKTPLITEWWHKDLACFCFGQHKNDFAKMAQEAKFEFRSGFPDLVRFGVPTVVLSAGVKEIITSVVPAEIKVVANEFVYGSDMRVTGYLRDRVISSANKEQAFYLSRESEKRNVFLLGDMLSDARMACDSKHEHVVRVGYYNTLEKQYEESEKFR